jgi:hypothetical protein
VSLHTISYIKLAWNGWFMRFCLFDGRNVAINASVGVQAAEVAGNSACLAMGAPELHFGKF